MLPAFGSWNVHFVCQASYDHLHSSGNFTLAPFHDLVLCIAPPTRTLTITNRGKDFDDHIAGNMEYLQDYSNEGAHSPRGGEPCEDRTAETKTTVLHAMHSTQRDFKASYPGVSSKGSIHSERLIAEMFINCRKSWGRSLATMIRIPRRLT